MEYKEQIEKLRKLKELAEHGVDGEKEAAKALLTKLLSKYGISLLQLRENQPKDFEFSYKNEYEEEIICGCIFTFGLEAYSIKSSGRTLKRIATTCTPQQYAELVPMVEWHLKTFREELKSTALAYRYKHKLFQVVKEKTSRTLQMSEEESLALLARARGLSDKAYTGALKRIGEEGEGK